MALPLVREDRRPAIAPRRLAAPAPASRRSDGRTTNTDGRTAGAAGRPKLSVVPQRRSRRWPMFVATVVWTVVAVGLLGTAVFHTQLAERQLEIDRLDRAVTAERERFDELRNERAALRSPMRLAEAASALGMSRGDASTFVSVTPEVVARQLAAAGAIEEGLVEIVMQTDPLDQFRAVKAVTEGHR